MNCPCCNDAMIVLELNKVEVDYCTKCGGIWLDSGELELLLQDTNERDKVLNSFAASEDTREDKRRCPICLKRMEKVLCGSDKKILIDRCPKNHGLWFDRGELHDVLGMIGNSNGRDSLHSCSLMSGLKAVPIFLFSKRRQI